MFGILDRINIMLRLCNIVYTYIIIYVEIARQLKNMRILAAVPLMTSYLAYLGECCIYVCLKKSDAQCV